jgi:BirA family transcriptional regulator, biotin operon repressor / biotin---[acetyl-CoA-carboxylase] ligase
VTSRTHKALFPLLRRLSDGRFHSGQGLAHEFGLSRASIYNTMTLAESMGLTIHAVRGRGYRMPDPVDWLDADALSNELGDMAGAYSIHLYDSLDSTNTSLMEAAMNGAADGTLFCTEHQQSGKGRRGRQWHSVVGGSLTFSIAVAIRQWSAIPFRTESGGGVGDCPRGQSPQRHPARLKWPNDVLVDYRKLAGVLVEVQGDLHGRRWP